MSRSKPNQKRQRMGSGTFLVRKKNRSKDGQTCALQHGGRTEGEENGARRWFHFACGNREWLVVRLDVNDCPLAPARRSSKVASDSWRPPISLSLSLSLASSILIFYLFSCYIYIDRRRTGRDSRRVSRVPTAETGPCHRFFFVSKFSALFFSDD